MGDSFLFFFRPNPVLKGPTPKIKWQYSTIFFYFTVPPRPPDSSKRAWDQNEYQQIKCLWPKWPRLLQLCNLATILIILDDSYSNPYLVNTTIIRSVQKRRKTLRPKKKIFMSPVSNRKKIQGSDGREKFLFYFKILFLQVVRTWK